MRSLSARLLPLYAVVCLLAMAAAAPAQDKNGNKVSTQKSKQPAIAKTATKPESAGPSTATPSSTSTPSKANSAPSLAFMSKLEQEVLDEMNLARMEPQKYAGFVEDYKKYYNGNRLTLPGRTKAIVTNDGLPAVDEAINFLKAQSPLPAFNVSKGICLAAKDHATEISVQGIQGHRGSDGSTPNTRVDRYGSWEGAIGETIVYQISTAREMVISLIIDDGVPTRGHRRNIFDPNYRVSGISVSEPATHGSACVIDYVGGFKEKGQGTGNR